MAQNYKYTMANMKASMLTSGQAYQRPISPSMVRNITKNFNWNLVNPIKVSHRSGKYYVWDGQHTLTSIITLFGEEAVVPVCIYEGLSYQDEAYLAAIADENKKKMKEVEKDNALFESKDEEIESFVSICEGIGWNVAFNTGVTGKKYYVQNPSWVFRSIYKKHGIRFTSDFLNIFSEAFGGDPDYMRSPMMRGILNFMEHYEDQYDYNTLVKAVSGIEVSILKDNAHGDHVRSGNDRFGNYIYLKYDKKASGKKKLPNVYKKEGE